MLELLSSITEGKNKVCVREKSYKKNEKMIKVYIRITPWSILCLPKS